MVASALVQAGQETVEDGAHGLAGGGAVVGARYVEAGLELVKRRKFVVLCTNAVLLPKHLHKFTPSKNFAWRATACWIVAKRIRSCSSRTEGPSAPSTRSR